MFIIASTVVFLVSAVACHLLSERTGRTNSPAYWGTMGLIFGPLALLYLLLIKPHR